MDLTLAQAVLRAAVDHATSIGVRVSISVADEKGHEVLTARMDGAAWFTPHIAWTKARTCVAMGTDSSALADLDTAHPGLLRVIEEQLGFTLTTLGGGVVVRDGDVVLGSVAGSGAHPDQDAECARAGAAVWLD